MPGIPRGGEGFGFELTTEFTHRAIHLSGELESQWAAVSEILSIIVFVILTIYLARRMTGQREAAARDRLLIKGLVATLLALLVTSKVFMPQYLLWIAPLAALLAHDDDSRIRHIGWRLFAVNLLSVVLFFFFYPDLIKVDFLPAVLLLIRNVSIVWLVASLLLTDKRAADQREPMLRITPRVGKYLFYVPVVLLFAWGTISAFCPVSTNDLWLLLREAADIVASGKIPRVEQYSAVAFGRPYLAHEWLSGLIFLGIFKLGGGEALTVLRASVMLAMLLLLWYSLEKKDRSFMPSRSPVGAGGIHHSHQSVCATPSFYPSFFMCLGLFPGALAAGAPAALPDHARAASGPLGEPAWGLHLCTGIRGADDRGHGRSRVAPRLVKRRKLRLVGCEDVRCTDGCLPGRQPAQSQRCAIGGIFADHGACQRLYQASRL